MSCLVADTSCTPRWTPTTYAASYILGHHVCLTEPGLTMTGTPPLDANYLLSEVFTDDFDVTVHLAAAKEIPLGETVVVAGADVIIEGETYMISAAIKRDTEFLGHEISVWSYLGRPENPTSSIGGGFGIASDSPIDIRIYRVGGVVGISACGNTATGGRSCASRSGSNPNPMPIKLGFVGTPRTSNWAQITFTSVSFGAEPATDVDTFDCNSIAP